MTCSYRFVSHNVVTYFRLVLMQFAEDDKQFGFSGTFILFLIKRKFIYIVDSKIKTIYLKSKTLLVSDLDKISMEASNGVIIVSSLQSTGGCFLQIYTQAILLMVFDTIINELKLNRLFASDLVILKYL